jgi:hypothetical protein
MIFTHTDSQKAWKTSLKQPVSNQYMTADRIQENLEHAQLEKKGRKD